MTWTWEEVEADWLAGSRVAVSPEVIVDAFNRVENMLGRAWLEQSRIYSGVVVRGSSPTLRIVSMGQRFSSLDHVRHTEKLLERIRKGDYDAEAELTALHLISTDQPRMILELEPEVAIGTRKRQPDFRVWRPGNPWTYVEVTQPGVSEFQEEVQAILTSLSGLVTRVRKPFALEVFLRRAPSIDEIEHITQRVPAFCQKDGMHSEDLPGQLGKLFLNHDEPGELLLRKHEGEEDVPRLGAVSFIRGPDQPHRHVAVRIAFTDDRAAKFLKRKASQLSKDRPGLIMIQMSNAAGAFRSWEPLLARRFQPNQHTRVSAICLWLSGLEPTPEGEAWIPQTKLLLNPHARHRLPSWIVRSLTRFHPKSAVDTLLG